MAKPFIVGSVASGRKFIGRKEYLKKIAPVMRHSTNGCISVTGLPRIGKTSIVQMVLRTYSKGVLPVYVNLASMTSFFDLWMKICQEIFILLDGQGVLFAFEQYQEKISSVCRQNNYEELRECLIVFFKELAKEKYKCVIAIDEFDHVLKKVFGDKEECGTYLNFMRDLFSQRSDVRLSLIVISRRDVASIEGRISAGSTFHGVFGDNIIGIWGFNDNDYERYLQILRNNKINHSPKTINFIEVFGGRFPYLLAQVGNYLCENKDNAGSIVQFSRNQGMINYYKDLIEILKRENYYETMIKIFIGPKYDLKQFEVETLINMGYVFDLVENGIKKKRSISKDFTHYFHDVLINEDNTNIWPNLNETELHLREKIKCVLLNKYGNNWENEIKKIYQQKFSQNQFDYKQFVNLEKAEVFISIQKKNYPGHEYNLLKVLAIWELKNLVNYFWNDGMKAAFQNVPKDELTRKLDLLQRARDPLAHANPEYLTPDEVRFADIYCNEIKKL
jgi:viroplasmin and RNaseH domain-containing protein